MVRKQPVFITQMGEANDGARQEIQKQQVHRRLKKNETEKVMPAGKACNARTIPKTVNDGCRAKRLNYFEHPGCWIRS